MSILKTPGCLLVLFIFSISQALSQSKSGQAFFVGTYTGGQSEGIYEYMLHKDGSLDSIKLAAKAINPSFLTLSSGKHFLLVANEKEQGTVESFLIAEDTLLFVNKRSSGGSSPCYVSVNSSNYVLSANFGSGTVGLLKVDDAGQLSALLSVVKHHSEVYPVAHAHSAQFVPNSNLIVSADLGTNELWFYNLDTIKQRLNPFKQPILMLPDSSGPRHFVQHPNGKWIYVVSEMGNSVTLVKRTTGGKYMLAETVSTLSANYKGTSYCSDIHLSPDNRFLYASNRGFNSIAIFKVNQKDGAVTLIGNEPTRGDFPRNFALSSDGNYLITANQKSDNIVAFKRNKHSGLLQYVDEIAAPTPVCILFFRK